MSYAMEVLQAQLAIIDHNLAVLKAEGEMARAIRASHISRQPRKKQDPPLCHFTVITAAKKEYRLSAYTFNPKKYATELFKETACTVRVDGIELTIEKHMFTLSKQETRHLFILERQQDGQVEYSKDYRKMKRADFCDYRSGAVLCTLLARIMKYEPKIFIGKEGRDRQDAIIDLGFNFPMIVDSVKEETGDV